jgi:hypothetical protein
VRVPKALGRNQPFQIQVPRTVPKSGSTGTRTGWKGSSC